MDEQTNIPHIYGIGKRLWVWLSLYYFCHFLPLYFYLSLFLPTFTFFSTFSIFSLFHLFLFFAFLTLSIFNTSLPFPDPNIITPPLLTPPPLHLPTPLPYPHPNPYFMHLSLYYTGDAVEGVPELTPVAIMSGKMLARRIYGNSKTKMVYQVSWWCVIFSMVWDWCVGLHSFSLHRHSPSFILPFSLTLTHTYIYV